MKKVFLLPFLIVNMSKITYGMQFQTIALAMARQLLPETQPEKKRRHEATEIEA